jgi:hypothetical protein
VQAEAIIAAIVGALSGGGGMRLLGRLIGPERNEAIAKYYRNVIKGLQKENNDLRKRISSLERRITGLEIAQDDPPGHLG